MISILSCELLHGDDSTRIFLALSNHPVTMATRACVLVVDLLMTITGTGGVWVYMHLCKTRVVSNA